MSQPRMYNCDLCLGVFRTKSALTNHLKYRCLADDQEVTSPVAIPYRTLVDRAAENDAAYSKYKGRINLTEPNGMSAVWSGMRGK